MSPKIQGVSTKQIALTAFKTIVNKLYQGNFDTIYIENKKGCQN